MPFEPTRNSRLKTRQIALLLTGTAAFAFTLPADLHARAKKPQPALKECFCRCAPEDESWVGIHTEFVLEGASCPADGGASCSMNVHGTWQDGEVFACEEKSAAAQSKPVKPKKRSPWKRQTSEPAPRSTGETP